MFDLSAEHFVLDSRAAWTADLRRLVDCLVRRKEQLPPGFFPDEAEPPAKRGRGASPVPKRVRFKPVDREAAMG